MTMICRHSRGNLLLLFSVLSFVHHYGAEAMPNPYSIDRWAEPHDAKWEEQVAKNRRFLTRKGRESLEKEHEDKFRKLSVVEEIQDFIEGSNEQNPLSSRTRGEQSEERKDERDLQVVDPSISSLNVLVCLIQWKGHEGRDKAVSLEDYEALFNGEGRDAELYPGGTIKDYFDTMSFGEFDINFEVRDWFQSEYTEQAFTGDGSQGRTQELQAVFAPVLDHLDDDMVQFRNFDKNFDRIIDMTIFLHSGYDATSGGVDCETGKKANERIGSHARNGASFSTWLSRSGYQLGSYAVAPAFRGTCDTEIGRIGTIVHELIHPFGVPDLYDMELNYGTGNIGGIDRFGVMANPSGNAGGDLAWPGHVSAWTRLQMEWVEPTVIDSDGTYEIRPIEKHPDMYKITKGFADKEYLLIENRQPTQGDFDEKFFNPGGILIYHVDENVWDVFSTPNNGGKGNFPRGGPFLSGWPGNGKHYPVALLQADGLYEIEQGINGGQSADLWNDPSQVLGPGNGEKVASKANYPNTDSYAFGTIKPTGITIKNFQTKGDGTMTFQVCGLSGGDCKDDAPPPDTKPPTNSPTKSPTRSPTRRPTGSPTRRPTGSPTRSPTRSPTKSPISDDSNGTPISDDSGETSIDDNLTDAPTSAPTVPSTPRVELENGNCEIAANAFNPDGPKGISKASNSEVGTTCDGEERRGVWYKIEAGSVPPSETIQADTCFSETSAMHGVSVFKGNGCDNLECITTETIGCKNGEMGQNVYWVAEPDVDYYLFMHRTEDSMNVDVEALGDGGLLLDILVFPQLANDYCPEAISVPTDGTIISGSTSGARPDFTGISDANCGIESAGVWYKVDGTGSELRATTCLPGTQHATQIHVFSGSCENTTCVSAETNNYAVCDNFDTATNSATVNWKSEEGVEYFILVGSRDESFGLFDLSVSEFVPATNDQCSNATDFLLPETQNTIAGSTKDATNDYPYGSEYCGAPLDTAGVWYTVQGTGDGLSISTCGQNNYNSAISVFKGSDCNQLECVTGVSTRDPACNFDGVTAAWLSQQNETYHVYVHGSAQNSYGNFELLAETFSVIEPNEFCNEATPITKPDFVIEGTTINATHSAPTNTCGVYNKLVETVNPGLWYTFEGTGHPVEISACPSNGVHDHDVSVSVFTGETCGEISCVSGTTFTKEFCAGDPDGTQFASDTSSTPAMIADNKLGVVWYATVPGVTYYAFVHGQAPPFLDGSNETVGVGDFRFHFKSLAPVNVTEPPAPDDDSGSEEDTETDSELSEKKNPRFNFNYLYFGLLLFLIPPLCIFREKIFNCCRYKYKDGEEDEWDPSRPHEDVDMEEAPFNDERSEQALSSRKNVGDTSSKQSSKFTVNSQAGLLANTPTKNNWQTLSTL